MACRNAATNRHGVLGVAAPRTALQLENPRSLLECRNTRCECSSGLVPRAADSPTCSAPLPAVTRRGSRPGSASGAPTIRPRRRPTASRTPRSPVWLSRSVTAVHRADRRASGSSASAQSASATRWAARRRGQRARTPCLSRQRRRWIAHWVSEVRRLTPPDARLLRATAGVRLRCRPDPHRARVRRLGARDRRARLRGRKHIVFGAGQYSPSTPATKRLLAHDLVHVLQQDGGQEVVHRAPVKPPRTAAALPRFDFLPSAKGASHACLLFVHNDERNARRTAALMHDRRRRPQRERQTGTSTTPGQPIFLGGTNGLFGPKLTEPPSRTFPCSSPSGKDGRGNSTRSCTGTGRGRRDDTAPSTTPMPSSQCSRSTRRDSHLQPALTPFCESDPW